MMCRTYWGAHVYRNSAAMFDLAIKSSVHKLLLFLDIVQFHRWLRMIACPLQRLSLCSIAYFNAQRLVFTSIRGELGLHDQSDFTVL